MALSAGGILLALLSLVANGTFGIFGKLCSPAPDPVQFNAFMAIGVLLSSLAVVPFLPLVHDGSWALGWTWPGALAGTLLVLATLNSFIAIALSGLAVAQATWSSVALLVSFLWGALGPRRGGRGPGAPVGDWGPTGAALVLLLLGVALINVAGSASDAVFGRGPAKVADTEREREEVNATAEDPPLDLEVSEGSQPSETPAKALSTSLLGLLAAVLVGVCGGSILVPAAYVEEGMGGLLMLPSFGVAAGVVGVLIGALYSATRHLWSPDEGPDMQPGKLPPTRAMLFGIASGVVWNVGNVCQILALHNCRMPYGISCPILQCALVVAGLWGILLFKEMTDRRRIWAFLAGSGFSIGGVVLLSLFGPGA